MKERESGKRYVHRGIGLVGFVVLVAAIFAVHSMVVENAAHASISSFLSSFWGPDDPQGWDVVKWGDDKTDVINKLETQGYTRAQKPPFFIGAHNTLEQEYERAIGEHKNIGNAPYAPLLKSIQEDYENFSSLTYEKLINNDNIRLEVNISFLYMKAWSVEVFYDGDTKGGLSGIISNSLIEKYGNPNYTYAQKSDISEEYGGYGHFKRRGYSFDTVWFIGSTCIVRDSIRVEYFDQDLYKSKIDQLTKLKALVEEYEQEQRQKGSDDLADSIKDLM